MTSAGRSRKSGAESLGELIEDFQRRTKVEEEPSFGLLFDIDGVLGRGANVLPEAVEAFKLLCEPEAAELRVPVAFVTNGCCDTVVKAELISRWFGIEIFPDQIIMAPSPLSAFKQYQDKLALFVGQDEVLEIAHSLGFRNAITLADVKAAYPLLDMVDHSNRRLVARGYPEPKVLERIEVIILIGEPNRWESHLQLLIDLLMTDGKPDQIPEKLPEEHLPVIACNMDLVYMDRAILPRFGHGAFLVCLESLYQRFTGRKLNYTAILGKPSEITFRFAEHTLNLMTKRMGNSRPIERLYFLGDNPEVDILGSNLYNNFLSRFRHLSGGDSTRADNPLQHQKASVCRSRTVPPGAELLPQTAKAIDSILVCTGVYNPHSRARICPSYCHRDFQGAADLVLPTFEVENCLEGITTVLDKENFFPSNVK